LGVIFCYTQDTISTLKASHMYVICDFSMFSKGDVMWAKRVIHNKSTVSKMLCITP